MPRRAARTSETSRPEARRHPDPVADVLLQPPDVRLAHHVPDPGALLRAPERVLDEDRQQLVGRVDEPVLRLLRRSLEQDALVGDAGAVVDAVVDREPVAEILEHGAARRAGDQAEARDDQALEEDLHLEDLLLERLRLERHLRQLVEVGVALRDAAGLVRELQPRLDVAGLVLHHRRVVELRLAMRRQVEQLRRHLDRELVRLQLLGDHRAPDGLAPLLPLRRGARAGLGDRRDLAPRHVPHLPLLLLRQLVEAEDAASLVVLGRVVCRLPLRFDQRRVRRIRIDRLLCRLDGHRAKLIAVQRSPPRSWCAWKKFSEPAVAIADEAEISSASAAAATICANRCTLPLPAQSISASQSRA